MKTADRPLTPIAIHGVPRSGTTWIGEIINSSPNILYRYQPLFSYAHKDCLTPQSSLCDINRFFSRIATCNDYFTCQIEQRRSGALPSFEKGQKTHIAYKEVRYHNILTNLMRQKHDLKLVTIIRNPLSVISSWLTAPREFRKDLGWDIAEEWRYAKKKNMGRPEEFYGFDKWKEASNLFLKLSSEYPDRVYVIKYSAFVDSLAQETKGLFDFLNLEVSEQTTQFIQASTSQHKSDPYSVYKRHRSDDYWDTVLPKEVAEEIQYELKGSSLANFLI